MFKKEVLETPPDRVNTIIGKDAYLKGVLKGKGLFRIDGKFDGSLASNGDIIIGESGWVKADLKGRNVTIAGRYEGELDAEGRLELKKTATFSGSIKADALLVEDGAILAGNVDMKLKEQAGKSLSKKEAVDGEEVGQTLEK